MLRISLASLVLLGSVTLARAQPAQPSAPMLPPIATTTAVEPETPLHASLTWSPIHLSVPAVELTAEFAVTPKIGVAAIGAIGSVAQTGTDDRVLVYEAGLSPRYYVWGNFRKGVELGVEALYAHASQDSQLMTVSLKAEGLAVGPYVGYKWVASFGLTLEAQLGVSYFAIRGDVADNESRVLPIVNLQVGWSF